MDPLSGLFNIGGGIINNLMAGQRQEQAQAFNAQQASNQMAFQERMRSTAYQTSVEDMRKAGLNPMMMAGINTSAPSGAAASTGPAPVSDIGISSGLQTAMQAMKMNQELRNLKETEKNLQVDNMVKNEDVLNRAADTYQKMAGTLKTKGETKIINENFESAVNNALQAKNERPYLKSSIAEYLSPTARGMGELYKLIPPLRVNMSRGASGRDITSVDHGGGMSTTSTGSFDNRFNASFGR